MSIVSVSMIKELRGYSGAGMMDCKKALLASKGDIEIAIDWLRKQGVQTASKRSEKLTAEGLISILTNSENTKGSLVEVNTETDFVARNIKFQTYVNELTKFVLNSNNFQTQDLEKNIYPNTDRTFHEQLNYLISIIGENIFFKHQKSIQVKEGIVSNYIHNLITKNMGKIGVLVGIESKGDKEILNILGKKIAMHIAAKQPIALERKDVKSSVINREREIYYSQAIDSGKPKNIIDKIVDGKLNKFFKESVLLEQSFVMDMNLTVKQFIKNIENDINKNIRISSFACLIINKKTNY